MPLGIIIAASRAESVSVQSLTEDESGGDVFPLGHEAHPSSVAYVPATQ